MSGAFVIVFIELMLARLLRMLRCRVTRLGRLVVLALWLLEGLCHWSPVALAVLRLVTG